MQWLICLYRCIAQLAEIGETDTFRGEFHSNFPLIDMNTSVKSARLVCKIVRQF
jgi:hypothetical protein